jgi:hypothetical protein
VPCPLGCRCVSGLSFRISGYGETVRRRRGIDERGDGFVTENYTSVCTVSTDEAVSGA